MPPIPWQEEQSLSAGIVRDFRRAIYIPPAWNTTYTYCQVEATSKAFAAPPVYGSSEPRPSGMMVYRNDPFNIGFGSRVATSPAEATAEPFYRTVANADAGYVPGSTAWVFPLYPTVQTVFVYSVLNTSLLQASWIYGK